jgi:hypothetical protein
MNAESGVHDLFGDGVLGHRIPLWFLAKAPRTPRTQRLILAWLIPPAARFVDPEHWRFRANRI